MKKKPQEEPDLIQNILKSQLRQLSEPNSDLTADERLLLIQQCEYYEKWNREDDGVKFTTYVGLTIIANIRNLAVKIAEEVSDISADKIVNNLQYFFGNSNTNNEDIFRGLNTDPEIKKLILEDVRIYLRQNLEKKTEKP